MLKRAFDVLVAATALLLLWPVMLVTAVLVRLRLGSPVLFAQVRPGLHGKPFRMLKFRTMTDERDAQGQLLPDSQRLTPFGAFLRSSSLDELPELWNILRGEMSVVGPRPLLMQYLPLYDERQRRRHEVRPGLTGLAQINGRNQIGWDERLELDVRYVETRTFWLDLRVFFTTFLRVVQRRGINEQGSATMRAFEGSSRPRAVPGQHGSEH